MRRRFWPTPESRCHGLSRDRCAQRARRFWRLLGDSIALLPQRIWASNTSWLQVRAESPQFDLASTECFLMLHHASVPRGQSNARRVCTAPGATAWFWDAKFAYLGGTAGRHRCCESRGCTTASPAGRGSTGCRFGSIGGVASTSLLPRRGGAGAAVKQSLHPSPCWKQPPQVVTL